MTLLERETYFLYWKTMTARNISHCISNVYGQVSESTSPSDIWFVDFHKHTKDCPHIGPDEGNCVLKLFADLGPLKTDKHKSIAAVEYEALVYERLVHHLLEKRFTTSFINLVQTAKSCTFTNIVEILQKVQKTEQKNIPRIQPTPDKSKKRKRGEIEVDQIPSIFTKTRPHMSLPRTGIPGAPLDYDPIAAAIRTSAYIHPSYNYKFPKRPPVHQEVIMRDLFGRVSPLEIQKIIDQGRFAYILCETPSTTYPFLKFSKYMQNARKSKNMDFFKNPQLVSILLQIVCVCQTMEAFGMIHNDLHSDNIFVLLGDKPSEAAFRTHKSRVQIDQLSPLPIGLNLSRVFRAGEAEVPHHASIRVYDFDHAYVPEIGLNPGLNGWLCEQYGHCNKRLRSFDAATILGYVWSAFDKTTANGAESANVILKSVAGDNPNTQKYLSEVWKHGRYLLNPMTDKPHGPDFYATLNTTEQIAQALHATYRAILE